MKTARFSFLSAALTLLLALLLSSPLFADAGDPPTRVARLSYLDGNVSFEAAGQNQWSQARLNYPMTTGDRVFTDARSRAELETGNIAIRVSGNTDLTTTSLDDQIMQFGLAQGSLRVRTYNLLPGGSVEVDTPNVALTVTQPGSYRFDTFPDTNTTLVTVDSGYVEVTGAGVNQTVRSGQSLRVSGANPLQADYVGMPSGDDFDRWSSTRDGRYLNSPSAQYVSRSIPGYYDLDTYGNWVSASEYGPVWYPSAVPAGWAPYRYGRWAWISPWGWTWIDDEPWGFAPFHYGRWAFIGSRWGWFPGPINNFGFGFYRPVYSPALVAFVGGSGFSLGFGFGGGGITAWFPLGPREPFFPWYRHSDGYLRGVNVTNIRNVNITNFNNIHINNINYVNRNAAFTAVRTDAFRNAQPVARNFVRVDQQQASRGEVLSHLEAAPAARAFSAGRSTAAPPVSAARPEMVRKSGNTVVAPVHGAEIASNRGTQPNSSAARNEVRGDSLDGLHNTGSAGRAAGDRPQFVTRNSAAYPSARQSALDQSGVSTHNTADRAVRTPAALGSPSSDRPQLVTRNAPPANHASTSQNSGRSLDPSQPGTTRQNRSVSPTRDSESAPRPGRSRSFPAVSGAPGSEPRPALAPRPTAETRGGPAASRPAPEARSSPRAEPRSEPRSEPRGAARGSQGAGHPSGTAHTGSEHGEEHSKNR